MCIYVHIETYKHLCVCVYMYVCYEFNPISKLTRKPHFSPSVTITMLKIANLLNSPQVFKVIGIKA